MDRDSLAPARPEMPLPRPLRGMDKGTFAHKSVLNREPAILKRTIQLNDFPSSILERLEELLHEMPDAPVRRLRDHGAPDAAQWDRFLSPYQGRDWLEIPWLLNEFYFHRRILEATGYYESGVGWKRDPFKVEKQRGLEDALDDYGALLQQAGDLTLEKHLHLSLWGNQADFSMWSADSDHIPDHADGSELEHLVVDESTESIRLLQEAPAGSRTVELIADNAGAELISDICLIDFLLSTQVATSVRLHLKMHPTFVSDATIDDLEQTLAGMRASAYSSLRQVAARLDREAEAGRLRVLDDSFWTAPLAFWHMPERMYQLLSSTTLIIVKGDANYRRLLGDLHWPYTTPFQQIVCYMPAPLLALRTLKSEVMCGLEPERIEHLDSQEAEWVTSGRWGMMQFAAP